MNTFKSFIIAFSMYSKVPMPKVEWTKESMKYAICFFPLVGAVSGALLLIWGEMSKALGFNDIIFAAVATYIPILVSGGIHMDGFCDTTDALASNQSMEKRIEILSDSNCGAFAVIKCGIYYILYFAVFTQLNSLSLKMIACGFVLSRTLSGIAVINFKSAKNGGLAYTFKDMAHKKTVTVSLWFILILCLFAMLNIDATYALTAFTAAILVFIYYKNMSYKKFGGVSGDLAGYFLQLCEIYMCYSLIILQGVLNIWS